MIFHVSRTIDSRGSDEDAKSNARSIGVISNESSNEAGYEEEGVQGITFGLFNRFGHEGALITFYTEQ